VESRSRWPRGLRRRSWPLVCWDNGFESHSDHWCFSSCLCVVLFCVGRGLCNGLITRPKSCRVSNKTGEIRKWWSWPDQGCSKAVPLHAWGKRRYSSYSFSTSALDRCEWSASRTGRVLPRRKNPRYALYRRLGGPQNRSGHRGYRKNLLPLPGIEPRSPGRPIRSQTLYWLN
jgi:hypothetical protein